MTRQEVEQWLKEYQRRRLSYIQTDTLKFGLAEAYLLTLDMIDRIRRVLESPCGVEQQRLVLAELKKFDEKEVKSK